MGVNIEGVRAYSAPIIFKTAWVSLFIKRYQGEAPFPAKLAALLFQIQTVSFKNPLTGHKRVNSPCLENVKAAALEKRKIDNTCSWLGVISQASDEIPTACVSSLACLVCHTATHLCVCT